MVGAFANLTSIMPSVMKGGCLLDATALEFGDSIVPQCVYKFKLDKVIYGLNMQYKSIE